MESVDKGFGNTFKEAREAMGLSQREVAEELKLAWKSIEGLEDENFESLPPYVFVRGYVKTYSKLVNLDSDVMAAQLASLYEKADHDRLEKEQKKPSKRMSPLAVIRLPQIFLGLGIFFVLVIAVILINSEPGEEISDANDEPSDGLLEDARVVVELETTDSTEKEEVTIPPTSGFELGTKAAVSDSFVENVTTPMDGGSSIEIARSDNDQRELSSTQIEVLTPSETPFIDIGEEGQEGQDTLEVEFSDDCWYEIGDTNENVLTADLGRSGEIRRFRGNAPFKIKLGYAPGVTIRFNGGAVELAPYTRNNIAVFRLGRRGDNVE